MGLYLGKEKVSNVASVITQNADSMATEIQNHIADTNIHITADERTKWNAAAENSSSTTEDFASTGVMSTTLDINNNAITNVNKINFTDYLNTSDGSTTCYTKLTKTDTINNLLTEAGNNIQYNGDYVLSFQGADINPPQLLQIIQGNNGSLPTVMLNNIADPATNYDAANKHYVDSKALPTTSTADNGKVLSVVNGAWAAAAMSSGAYVGSYTGNGSTTTNLSKTLTFNFKPALIVIEAFDSSNNTMQAMSQIIYGSPGFTNETSASANLYICSWSNNSITMTAYGNYASIKYINYTGYTYYYIAIPAMN